MERKYDEELIELAKKIWSFAEIKFKEYKSSKAQMELLEKHGFEIESGLAHIPTAFKAVYGKGKPAIGFLGEFDALSGLSQEADKLERKEVEKGACGHGCGHHMLGTASIGAALQLKDYIEENNLDAKVIYFGCPGEEGGSGKAFMAKAGVFDDADIALTWHPFNGNAVLTGSMQANKQVYVRFYGQGSHAAFSPELGRSALDGLELLNVGLNFLREHIKSDERLHYAITDTGGKSPNVVQAFAEGLYLLRSPSIKGLDKLYERFETIVEGAALMTETKAEIIFDKACSNIVPNEVIEKVLYEAFKEEGPVIHNEEELQYAKNFREILPDENLLSEMSLQFASDEIKEDEMKYLKDHILYDKILEYTHSSSVTMGSSDVGDVSNVIPTSQIIVACYAIGTSVHSWQEVAQGKASYAFKGMLKASDVLANAAKKFLEKPELIEEARDELIKRRGPKFVSPIPNGQIPMVLRKDKY